MSSVGVGIEPWRCSLLFRNLSAPVSVEALLFSHSIGVIGPALKSRGQIIGQPYGNGTLLGLSVQMVTKRSCVLFRKRAN